MSRVMAFLLRATTGHQSDLPLIFSWPQARKGSPWLGGSILMTSAPRSPSNWPQKGPASNVPISMTRRSESGPLCELRPLGGSCQAARPLGELRGRRRRQSCFGLAPALELLDGLEAAIEEFLLTPGLRHLLT